jgi:hypothetical protein
MLTSDAICSNVQSNIELGIQEVRERTEPSDRVAIWNSFFKLAWLEAQRVFEIDKNCRSIDTFMPQGGTLPDDQFHVVAAVVLCNLAIEARANHLIEELIESGKITADVGQAARLLPTKHKWFILP